MKVRVGRRAVETQRMCSPLLFVFKLRRMAGRAGHADLPRHAVDDEADRQAFWITGGNAVRQIAVALQLVACERQVDVHASQRLEPGIGHHVRALASRIERVTVGLRPALLRIGEIGTVAASWLRGRPRGHQAENRHRERQCEAPQIIAGKYAHIVPLMMMLLVKG